METLLDKIELPTGEKAIRGSAGPFDPDSGMFKHTVILWESREYPGFYQAWYLGPDGHSTMKKPFRFDGVNYVIKYFGFPLDVSTWRQDTGGRDLGEQLRDICLNKEST